MKTKHAAWLLILLLAIGTVLPALGGREVESPPVVELPAVGSYPVPLLLVLSWSGGDRDAAQLELLRRSAAAAFAGRRPDARITVLPDSPTDRRLAASDADAVGWIEISVREQGFELEIEASAHAVAAITPVFEIGYTEVAGTGLPNLGRIWTRAATRFEETWPDLVDRALSDIRYTAVTIRAVPGTRISGLGDSARVVPESGMLRAEVAGPMVYTLEARAPRHYPGQKVMLVLEDDLDVTLEQLPRSAFSYDFALANLAYPSVDVSRRLGGDFLYVRVGLTSYLLGISPFDNDDSDDGEERVFASENMTVFNVQLGSYLGSPYASPRIYLSTGAVWRLIHTRGFWGGVPVAPWGFITTLGMETRPSKRWRLFFEWQPTLYATEYPEVLVRTLPGAVSIWGPQTSDAGIGADPAGRDSLSWILAGASARLGVRWQP